MAAAHDVEALLLQLGPRLRLANEPNEKEGPKPLKLQWPGLDNALPAGTPFPSQNQNRVVLTVETNHGKQGTQSGNYYNSFSLLKSLEAAFGLPCLNHSCDPGVNVMSDLFGHGDNW